MAVPPESAPRKSPRRGAPSAGRRKTRPVVRPVPRAPVRLKPRAQLGDPRRRLRFALAVVLLLFVVLGGRLMQLQFTNAPAYAALAAKQRTAEVTVAAPRGAILDRNGNRIAHSVPASAVYA